MKIDLKSNLDYLKEYVMLCAKEWGNSDINDEYINGKVNNVFNDEKVISVLGILNDGVLVGFISLFRYDGDERLDLTPWYATMYVKEEYRGKGYSKILNKMIIDEAKRLGYKKVYLKTDLINYYEKFGAIYIGDLECGEKLYYINCE